MPAPKPRSSELAYSLLRDMILDLRLPPGTVVNEQSLSVELSIGRTPIHEAIARLASDEFIAVMPRRGTSVTALTLKGVLDIFEAREAIECGIAYIAALRATDDDLAHMESLVESADEARESADAEKYLLADYQIHHFLVKMIDNSLLQGAADRLLLHNLRLWRFYFSTHHPHDTSMLSHAPLVSALRANDAERAQTLMREHIAASRQMLRLLF
ncbi:DNA-binding GntR family transcriptional regulator [Arthrobacter sp. GAS37]|uniref:GntR family transcriptional regulator n=1 Tax=Arthrobacter sp. GAS37 TaxID=3156261 RepID=UPI003832C441